MAEPDLRLTDLPLSPSPSRWLAGVLDNFDEFLKDHASCEKKASGMALNVASHYPDQPQLLDAMVDLAVEELNHYREVIRLLMARGVTPGPDTKDPYVHALNGTIRRGSGNFLLDRLLVGAVVERRGAERFGLIASGVEDPELARFYRAITASEERHWELFVELAFAHCDCDLVMPRLEELVEIEADVMEGLPLRAALH